MITSFYSLRRVESLLRS